jgi:putative hydrolase of the HAD superfamily
MTIKAVFFDLDDTLCNDAGAWIACSRFSANLATQEDAAIDPERLARAFLGISEAFWEGDQPLTDKRPILEIRVDQWAGALEAVGAESGDRTLARRLAADYGSRRSRDIDLFPDAVDVLTILREQGKSLVLITNGLRRTHQEKIEALGLERFFDHIVLADDVGHFKPEPEIFLHALALCGVLPQEAVMVGDHVVNDVVGPKAVGMRAILLNPNQSVAPVDLQVTTLSEVPELIRRLG